MTCTFYRKNYTGYSLESRLHFRIHNALAELKPKKGENSSPEPEWKSVRCPSTKVQNSEKKNIINVWTFEHVLWLVLLRTRVIVSLIQSVVCIFVSICSHTHTHTLMNPRLTWRGRDHDNMFMYLALRCLRWHRNTFQMKYLWTKN